jgi:hypothetical protein
MGLASRAGGDQELEAGVRQTGRRANGGGARTCSGAATFFDVPAQGQSIVYVIDRSGSMGLNGLLSVAKQELLASLRSLPVRTRFQVIVYNRLAELLRIDGRYDLVPATEANKDRVAALLEPMDAEGGTDHLAALRRALALQPDVIFFLTDAADLTNPQIRSVRLLNQGRSIIHVIELNAAEAPGEAALQVLARENNGQYKSVVRGP